MRTREWWILGLLVAALAFVGCDDDSSKDDTDTDTLIDLVHDQDLFEFELEDEVEEVEPSCGNGVVDDGEECDDGEDNSDSTPDACREDCTEARCGDAVQDDGEECDEGEDNSDEDADACRMDCTNPYCGDGVVDDGEACDDGEDNSDSDPDACRSDCSEPICGDGVIDEGETCDDGEDNSDSDADACRTNCQVASCGDGVLDDGESCDDGDQNSDTTADACRTTCELAGCGDGIVDSSEDCDGENLDGASCANLGQGFNGGDLSCSDSCAFDTAMCTAAPSCGDGVLDTDEGEECDDGVDNSDTLPNACRSNCLLAYCGDGVQDDLEACDDGLDNSDSTANACRTSCELPSCGDGVTDDSLGEECDDGEDNSDTEADACRTTCESANCGDGVIDGAESCDGSELGGETCESQSFSYGVLACRANCGFDTSGCVSMDAPGAGDLVITELMVDPGNLDDSEGEWIEIYNPSATESYLLRDCVLSDNGGESHTIADILIINPDQSMVLGRSDTAIPGGPDYVYSSFILTNTEDEVILTCAGTEVDRVEYDAEFNLQTGVSFQLDYNLYSGDNNDVASWCHSTEAFLVDLGSPGELNTTCPGTSCGNSSLDALEICDGTILDGQDCNSLGFAGGTLGCAADCLDFDTTQCLGAVCSDGVVDSPEQCDGDNLDGQTCESLGFAGGTLACNVNCLGFDTSGCSNCGNSSIDGGETCDGSALDGETCVSQGYGAGNLTCLADCSDYDFSLCDPCGNGVQETGETCDGSDLAGSTCTSEGFLGGGTLDCSATCDAFDYSNCNACGDGTVQGDEVCDLTDLNGQTCTSIGMGFSGGTLGCSVDCDGFDTSNCTSVPVPGAGELVITEFMPNPDGVSDSAGEYVELYNPSTTVTYELMGCMLSDNGTDHTISSSVLVAPQSYVVLAASDAPGFDEDYSYGGSPGFNNSSADSVILTCSEVVAQIDYTTSWPFGTGSSAQMNPSAMGTSGQYDVVNWCTSYNTTVIDNGDAGTPGQVNDTCPTCGNGVLEAGETCDGSETGTATCVSEGYVSGDLGCNVDCMAFDYTNCAGEICGNTVVEGSEDCDSWNLNGADCTTAGAFFGGTLSCADDCSFDVSECNLCGNDAIDSGEECDGTAAISESCSDHGFDSGALGCNSDCSYNYDACSGGTSFLFISEYVEGSGDNKAIEIYNPGSTAIDLAAMDCEVFFYFNGSTTANANSADLTGSIAAGGAFTVCNSNLVGHTCDFESSALGYNGDDAIELSCGGITQDVFGQIGTDPGTAWGSGDVFAQNHTLRRNCTVTEGDTDGSDAFDPSIEWTGYAIDTMDDLGQHCTGSGEVCGNDTTEGSEVCDGSDLNSQTCSLVDSIYVGGTLGCEADCSGYDTSACLTTLCGNGTLDSGEECDGGELNGESCTSVPGDYIGGTLACTSSCTFDTTSCTSASCGNNTTEGTEVCDGSDLNSQTCSLVDSIYVGGTLGCEADCSGYDTSACLTTLCGNGTLDSGEDCDGGELNGESCTSVPGDYIGGTLACTSSCTFDTTSCTSASCGNDTTEGSEVCDGSDLNSQTCSLVDSIYVGGTLGCALDCSGYDTSACLTTLCGNGTLDSGEECDTDELNGGSCLTVPGGYTGGTLSCAGDCTYDTSSCVTVACGNNTTEGSETCDGTDLNGETCSSVDSMYVGGTLGCAADCSGYDTSACLTTLCGNGTLDSGEECDTDELNGGSCLTVPGGYTGGTLSCADNCTYDTSACSSGLGGSPFFSEYIEGSSNNKAVEIYNPTAVDIDLDAAGCEIRLYSNGSTSVGGTIDLTGDPDFRWHLRGLQQ